MDVTLKLIKTIRFNSQITSTFGASISQMCMCIVSHQIEEMKLKKALIVSITNGMHFTPGILSLSLMC